MTLCQTKIGPCLNPLFRKRANVSRIHSEVKEGEEKDFRLSLTSLVDRGRLSCTGRRRDVGAVFMSQLRGPFSWVPPPYGKGVYSHRKSWNVTLVVRNIEPLSPRKPFMTTSNEVRRNLCSEESKSLYVLSGLKFFYINLFFFCRLFFSNR